MASSFNASFVMFTKLDEHGQLTEERFASKAVITGKLCPIGSDNSPAARGATVIFHSASTAKENSLGELEMDVKIANIPQDLFHWMSSMETYEVMYSEDGEEEIGHICARPAFAIQAWTPVGGERFAYLAIPRFTWHEEEISEVRGVGSVSLTGTSTVNEGLILQGGAAFAANQLTETKLSKEIPKFPGGRKDFDEATLEYVDCYIKIQQDEDSQFEERQRIRHNSDLVYCVLSDTFAEQFAKKLGKPIPDECADKRGFEKWYKEHGQELDTAFGHVIMGLRILANDSVILDPQSLTIAEFVAAYDNGLIEH